MSNVGFATLTIIPSAKGFASALGGEVNPAMGRAGREGGGLFGKSLLPSIGGLAVAAGSLFAAAGVGGFFKSAVQGAADLEQSVGAIQSVFKDSATQMLDWSDDAATAVGLTKNEYNQFATVLGSQLKNGGTALDELAPKTNNLIGIGADLASMFGGTTAEAVESLSSALRGERDPIEKYGVSLTQAAVDAKAAELGFAKVGGTLSQEANQAATLALIMDQTADAHGNFGREADTLSHKQQVLNALWQDGKARIGDALVPAISALTGALIAGLGPALDLAERGIKTVVDVVGGAASILGKGDFKPFAGLQEDSGVVDFLFRIREGVLTAVDGIGGAITKIGPYVAPIAGVIGGLALNLLPLLGLGGRIATAFGPMLATIGKLAPLLRVAAGPVGIIVGLLAALIASSPELQSQLMGLGSTLMTGLAPIFTTLAGAVSGLLPVITGALGTLGPVFTGLLTTLAPALSQVVGLITSVLAAVLPLASSLLTQLVPVFTQLITAVLPPLVAIFGQVAATIAPLVAQLVSALVPVLLDIVTAIMPIVTTIAGLLVPVIQNLMPVVTTIFGVIASVIGAVMQVVTGVIQVATGLISGNWSQVWTGIGNVFGGIWDLIKSLVTGALAIVVAVIGAALANIATVWSGAWNGISSFLGGIWSGITGAVSSGISGITGFFSALPGQILGFLGGLAGSLTSVGRNMIEGLLDGVRAVAGRIKDAVLGPIKDSVDAVKNFLGIHSPSRLFIGIGEFTGQGMAIGLQNTAGLVAKASDALIPTAPPTSYAAPTVRPGGLGGAIADSVASRSAGPLIGALTLQSSGDVREDLDEVNFYVRQTARGGLYA